TYHPSVHLLVCAPIFFLVPTPRPPISPLFPYTTLFRSDACEPGARAVRLWPYSARRARAHAIATAIVLWIGLTITFAAGAGNRRSEEHTSELQSPYDLVCRLLLEKKKNMTRAS